MLRSFISRSAEQEPAFPVKPWCLETGMRAGRFETILSKCLHAAFESKLGVLAPLQSCYSPQWIFANWSFILFSSSYLVPTTHENVFYVENEHSFVVLLIFLHPGTNSNFNPRRWHRTWNFCCCHEDLWCCQSKSDLSCLASLASTGIN